MALDETTRQLNKRAIEALANAEWRLREAELDVVHATEPLEDLSKYTNAHDPAMTELNAVSAQIRAAHEDVRKRWIDESEGKS